MLLLITTSLLAGWKWEKLDTGEGPPIYENSGDSFLDFHLAYDPMMEKLVLTYYNEETSMSDTWLFDGYNWTYDCTHLASSNQYNHQFEPNQMFYDESNKMLMDVRLYYCNPNPPHPYLCNLLCKKDNSDCWNCFLETEATSLTTYDINRRKALFFHNSFNSIFEWDGYQIHEVYFDKYYSADIVVYDEMSKLVIMYDWNRDITLEYDGVEIQEYEGLGSIATGIMSMSYNPKFHGVVAGFLPGNTYLYRNHSWQLLIGSSEDELPISLVGRMIYFPPTDQFLLLTFPWGEGGALIIYSLVRRHERPFQK